MNESFEVLRDQLTSSNNEQRHHAMFRLCTSYPAQSAVLILNIACDQEREEKDRAEARRWLLRRGGEEAAMVLLPYLQNHEEALAVRCLVARMLHHVRDKQVALPLLFACLHDAAWEIRSIAANRLGWGRWEDEQIIEQLVSGLQDPSLKVRLQAAEALCRLGDRRGVELLVDALQSSEPLTRSQAALALGSIVDERAVKALLACLQDGEENDRRMAISSLEKVGGRALIPAVLPHLHDPSWEVHQGILLLLGKWGDAQVVESLLACLRSERKWPTRRRICSLLGKWGDERAIDPLISCLHDQDSQYLAVRVIGVPPDHSGAAEVRAAAATALGQLGNVRALDALSACLSDENPEVQRAAAQALEQLRKA